MLDIRKALAATGGGGNGDGTGGGGAGGGGGSGDLIQQLEAQLRESQAKERQLELQVPSY